MGGIAYHLPATPIDKTADGPAFYRAVSAIVVANIDTLAGRGPAVKAVMSNYDIRYGASANETMPLHFSFYDGGGGCFLSMDLLMHWFIKVLESWRARDLDAYAEHKGFKLGAMQPIEHDVFVELRGRYYHPTIYEGKPYLSFDDHPDRVTYETLTDDERRLVDETIAKKICRCRMCAALTSGKHAKGPRIPKPKKDPLAGAIARKKEILIMDDPSVVVVPEVLRSAKQLRSLAFANVPISTVPDWVADLKLESFRLSETNVRALPALPTTLRSLSVFRTPIASFPRIELSLLKYLSITCCDVGAVDLSGYPALKSLSIDRCAFERVPGLDALSVLESANVSKNRITDVAPLFLPSVKSLHLDDNPIVELPDSIANAAGLTWLNVAGTRLRALPASLRELSALETLFVQGTELGPWRGWIDRIPSTLKQLYASIPPAEVGEVKKVLPNTEIHAR